MYIPGQLGVGDVSDESRYVGAHSLADIEHEDCVYCDEGQAKATVIMKRCAYTYIYTRI